MSILIAPVLSWVLLRVNLGFILGLFFFGLEQSMPKGLLLAGWARRFWRSSALSWASALGGERLDVHHTWSAGILTLPPIIMPSNSMLRIFNQQIRDTYGLSVDQTSWAFSEKWIPPQKPKVSTFSELHSKKTPGFWVFWDDRTKIGQV